MITGMAFGLPNPRPEWMSDEEEEHQNWSHEELGKAHKTYVQSWPWMHKFKEQAATIAFLHYGYNEEANWVRSFVKKPSAHALDPLFDNVEADLIFYGHNHDT